MSESLALVAPGRPLLNIMASETVIFGQCVDCHVRPGTLFLVEMLPGPSYNCLEIWRDGILDHP